MKAVAFLLLLLFFSNALQAQKENNVWVGGLWTALDFNSGQVEVFSRDSALWVNTSNASICDNDGSLLFYTNGYKVYDKSFNLMQNGNQLEIGDYESWGYGWNAVPDGAGILPIPDDSQRYYLFHVDLNYVTDNVLTNTLLPTHLFYSVVDMTQNNGKGVIVGGQKNIPILSDTLTSCGFKMVKHANGRDYWLICHEYNSDNYYRFLMDPFGIHGPYSQQIGYVFKGLNALGFSTLHFNEQATMAAQLSVDSTSVQLYDFDRCTGEFFNLRNFKVSDTLYQVIGAAFAPNGKFFYAATGGKYIWQFDVTMPDIFASRKLVAHYSGAMNPFETNFYQLRLAPDSKIYVHAYDWNRSLHVINYPDSSGQACGFVENALQINPPGYNWRGFPNIVNYHLGAVPGSPCDSLVSVGALPKATMTWSVYPNPFIDQFQIGVSGAFTKALVEVYDVLGQKVFTQEVLPFNQFIHQAVDLSNCASGVYFVSVEVNGERYNRKVVKK